ncbi:hypothetical protein LINGRAHAP2_LOCUS12540 [Linum grandiflorum]
MAFSLSALHGLPVGRGRFTTNINPSLHPLHLTCITSNVRSLELKTKMSSRNLSARCTGGLPIPDFSSLPPNPSPGSWKLWLVGLAMALVVPLWRKQLFSDVKERFDEVVNTVEKVADVVEDVAERVEKVADEIGNNLPAGDLRDAFQFIEDVADKTERSAELAGDVIDKVQELEEEVDVYIETTSGSDHLYEEHAKAKELKAKIEETKSKIDDQLATAATSTTAGKVTDVSTAVEATKSDP